MGMKVNGTTGLTFPDTTTLGSAGQSSVQAWVNFNGTGTVAIRANFNVSSITDNGTGDYTVNFANALVDANYSAVCSGNDLSFGTVCVPKNYTTSEVDIATLAVSPTGAGDAAFVNVAIFR